MSSSLLKTLRYNYCMFNNSFPQIGDTVITHREPNPDEARIQAMSVIAACAKGLMYFQSEVSVIVHNETLDHIPSSCIVKL